MVPVSELYRAINEQGINFFTGVPDSLLKDFCSFLSDHVPPERHIIAPNEGNAIAIGIGWHLGTAKIPMVYMQNSGIGNALNPIISLADPKIYGIPMLVLVGWRGEPGKDDEPQHIKQGSVMIRMLESVDLPWFLLSENINDCFSAIKKASVMAKKERKAVIILVGSKCLSKNESKNTCQKRFEMRREEAIKIISSKFTSDELFISTTGKASRELYELRESQSQSHEKDFLVIGGMGHASSIALGLARSHPNRKIICFDGDGSLLMHMGSLPTIGQSKAENIIHIVLNNGAHDSVGGQPTVALQIDLPGIARSCGYAYADSVENRRELDESIDKLLCSGGPAFVEVKINKGSRSNLARPELSPGQMKDLFMNNMHSEIGNKSFSGDQ